MARIRSVKPEFFSDQDLAEELPGRDGRDARMLYVGLWGISDEHGRLRGDSRFIKGEIYPYDDDLTPADIERLIDMLVATGRAVRYRVRSSVYLFLPKLDQHQRLEPDKVPSRLPGPDEGIELPAPMPPSGSRADLSARDSDESAPGRATPKDLALKQVAGSREQVAGSREHVRPARQNRAEADTCFDEFWATYPRREAKAAARKAWDKATTRASPEQIITAAAAYRDLPTRDPQYTKHPATWLNNDCWLDERPPPGNVIALRAPTTAAESTTDIRVRQALAAGAAVQAMLDGRAQL